MKRVGLAASKIAKGNLWLYNGFVILISFLFSLLVFVVSGSAVLFALIIIGYVSHEVMVYDFTENHNRVMMVSMVSLAIGTLIFNLLIISTNIKFKKSRK